jgi:hypothetical protein
MSIRQPSTDVSPLRLLLASVIILINVELSDFCSTQDDAGAAGQCDIYGSPDANFTAERPRRVPSAQMCGQLKVGRRNCGIHQLELSITVFLIPAMSSLPSGFVVV